MDPLPLRLGRVLASLAALTLLAGGLGLALALAIGRL